MLNLRRALLICFLLSGFAALIYEVVWTQLLTLIFGTSLYSFSIMLAAFFAGLGFGGYAGGKYIDGKKDAVRIFAYLEIGIGFSSLMLFLFFDKLGTPLYSLYKIGSVHLFMASIFFLSFIFMLIPTILMGATLPVVNRIYVTKKDRVGTDIGEVFSFNTFGAIFGSFSAGFILIPAIGLVRTSVIAALVNISAAFILYSSSRKEDKYRFFMVLFTAFAAVLYFSSFTLQPLVTGVYRVAHDPTGEVEKHFGEPQVVYSGSNAYGTVVVADEGKYRSLWINNKVDASTTEMDMSTQLLLGYLPMFANPEAGKVLNIGLGGGFTLGAIEAFGTYRIDVIELNPLVKESAGRYFREYNGDALENSRANFIIADARNYILTSNEKYDVIISEPSNIWVSGESNLFTREFYLNVREHLNETGVFSQWIPMYDFSEKDMKIFLNTIKGVFPHVTLWVSGTDGIVIASRNPVSLDYNYILKMLNQNQRIRNDLNFISGNTEETAETSEINLPDAVIKSYSLSDEDINIYSGNALFHTDDYPVLEFDTAKNFIFLKNEYSSIRSITEYINNRTEDRGYFAPIVNKEHREGDWLYLDFMGLKIKTDNSSRVFSGYKVLELYSITGNNVGYDKFASLADDRISYNVIARQPNLKTFKGDSEDVVFVKNIQRRSDTKNMMLKRYPPSHITEFKKDKHDAYMVKYLKDQRTMGTVGWYCEINNLIYFVDIDASDESEFEKINDEIHCYHE